MNQDDEIWQPARGFPGYEVSSSGRIRSYRRKGSPRIMKGGIDRYGYPYVTLQVASGNQKTSRIHKIVLESFNSPRSGEMQARHLNGNRCDNRIENLAWGTAAQNTDDKIRHGHAPRKLSENIISEMRVKNSRGESIRSLSRAYGVDYKTAYVYLRGL